MQVTIGGIDADGQTKELTVEADSYAHGLAVLLGQMLSESDERFPLKDARPLEVGSDDPRLEQLVALVESMGFRPMTYNEMTPIEVEPSDKPGGEGSNRSALESIQKVFETAPFPVT